jgi:uncharacterized protein (TIGR04255 family)
MKFHRSERVIYRKNPLIEVAVEVRFPLQLAIQDSLPIDFQKGISAEFPLLKLKNEVQVQINIDSQEPSSGQGLKSTQAITYSFSSIDRKWTVDLSAQSLRLSSMTYMNWENFESKLLLILQALHENYSVGYFTRTGLRYRDLIDRKALNCEDRPWQSLIDPRIVGPFIGYAVDESDCIDFQQNLSLRLDNGQVDISNGFVVHVQDRHAAFLIDADFHLDKTIKAEVNDVIELLRDFNVQAGGLFRQTISDELHELLQPSPVD